jgi:hypothetical protein
VKLWRYICIFLILLIKNGVAYNPQLVPEWDFYSYNVLSAKSAGRGLTGISHKDGLTNVLQNPATLSLKKSSQFQLEYGFKNNIGYSGHVNRRV